MFRFLYRVMNAGKGDFPKLISANLCGPHGDRVSLSYYVGPGIDPRPNLYYRKLTGQPCKIPRHGSTNEEDDLLLKMLISLDAETLRQELIVLYCEYTEIPIPNESKQDEYDLEVQRFESESPAACLVA